MDILRAVSTDNGVTWGAIGPLNSDAATDITNEVTLKAVYDPRSDRFHVVWTNFNVSGVR
jgi:hypothetical protein